MKSERILDSGFRLCGSDCGAGSDIWHMDKTIISWYNPNCL